MKLIEFFLRSVPILAVIVVSTRASLELKMLQVIGQQLLKTVSNISIHQL